jgi:hypothetical protein
VEAKYISGADFKLRMFGFLFTKIVLAQPLADVCKNQQTLFLDEK